MKKFFKFHQLQKVQKLHNKKLTKPNKYFKIIMFKINITKYLIEKCILQNGFLCWNASQHYDNETGGEW